MDRITSLKFYCIFELQGIEVKISNFMWSFFQFIINYFDVIRSIDLDIVNFVLLINVRRLWDLGSQVIY